MTIQVTTEDGRRLAVETWGDPNGKPAFLLHGTPGSRMGPVPRGPVLYRLGVRLIAFDRPGYGGSDRLSGRQVAAAAADVRCIADALALDTFAVVGRSGGGPHALACAALLGDRVTRAAALVSLAPYDAEDLDWYAGMAESNVREYSAAQEDSDRLAPGLEVRGRHIREDPARLIAALRRELPESDQRVVSDAGVRRMLERNYREGLRVDAGGWIDDSLAFSRPWGFSVEEIKRPVLLWHGQDDVFSPVEHSLWLARHIPDATVVVEPGAAHFGALRILPAILRWATQDTLHRPSTLSPLL